MRFPVSGAMRASDVFHLGNLAVASALDEAIVAGAAKIDRAEWLQSVRKDRHDPIGCRHIVQHAAYAGRLTWFAVALTHQVVPVIVAAHDAASEHNSPEPRCRIVA